MKKTLKNRHFWAIIAIMIGGAFVYYADQIPAVRDFVTQSSVWFARYTTHRILSIIPVAYAAFIFRFRGGAVTAVFISLALFPRALIHSSEQMAAVNEIVAFLFIGLLVSWLIERRQRAVDRRNITLGELAESLDTIKAQQLQLQLSEERYRGLFENSSEAILICANTGRIIAANQACQSLTGLSSDKLAEMSVGQMFSGADLEMVQQMISEEMDSATLKENDELRLERKDGREIFIQLKLSPMLKDNQVIGIQAIIHDITEERQLRQSMQSYVTRITEAQEAERKRISRELHDSTAQLLAGISRRLDSLLTRKGSLLPAISQELAKLHRLTDEALDGVRRFSQDLRPSILDDLGLGPSLEWLLADLEKSDKISTEFRVCGKPRRPSPETEVVIFRIVQETLSNVKKHARAGSVSLDVDFGDDALTILINDDGGGFDMPERPSNLVMSGKLGIVGMRERARLIGATLIVQSEVGAGTSVTLRIPEKTGYQSG